MVLNTNIGKRNNVLHDYLIHHLHLHPHERVFFDPGSARFLRVQLFHGRLSLEHRLLQLSVVVLNSRDVNRSGMRLSPKGLENHGAHRFLATLQAILAESVSLGLAPGMSEDHVGVVPFLRFDDQDVTNQIFGLIGDVFLRRCSETNMEIQSALQSPSCQI